MNNQNPTQSTTGQQPEADQEKQPYTAPALKKLGTVQELTQGIILGPTPDAAGFSM